MHFFHKISDYPQKDNKSPLANGYFVKIKCLLLTSPLYEV